MTTVFRFFNLCIAFFAIQFCVAQDDIQRVRIDFENPEGFTRHLLLGFTPDNAATDGFDYGYDALCPEDLSNDLNWMIDDQRFVTQGVGEFNNTKYYPLGMFMNNGGEVNISLVEIENFNEEIDVYLYDLEFNSYTLLNSVDYAQNIEANTYLNRFFITFSSSAHLNIIANNQLSISQELKPNVNIWFSTTNKELHLQGNFVDKTVFCLYNLEGKKVAEKTFTNQEYKFDASGLSSGIYILKISSSNFTYSSKVSIII